MYPIVKGSNISHAQLLSAYNSTNINDDIRDNPLVENALITTYEFDPLTGMTKMTDPSGRSTSFNYDTEERLSDIRDLNEHLVQDYDYEFKELDKLSGLAANAKSFGVVNPGTDKKDYVKITNLGNYDINISDIGLPPNFTSVWDNTPIYIPSGASFDLPIVFSAPTTTGSYQGNLIVLSDDINGNLIIPLTALSDVETRVLRIDPDCYSISTSFGSTIVRLYNDGNSSLYVRNITSTDACVTNDWGNIPTNPESRVIPAGGSRSVSVRLECSVGGTQNNWSENSELQVVYYQDVPSLAVMSFDLTNDNCGSTNNGRAYTLGVGSVTRADCTTTMSGTITVHYSSINVANIPTENLGPNFGGATVTISGRIGDIGPLENRVLQPGLYTFTSGTTLCNPGLGYSDLLITVD